MGLAETDELYVFRRVVSSGVTGETAGPTEPAGLRTWAVANRGLGEERSQSWGAGISGVYSNAHLAGGRIGLAAFDLALLESMNCWFL